MWTGRVCWLGETACSIGEALEAAAETAEARSATSEAAGWLQDYLTSQGGTDDSATIKRAGGRAGHSKDALLRALKRLKGTTTSSGFPRRTYWSLPGAAVQSTQPSRRSPGETASTATTASTASTAAPVSAVNAVNAVNDPLPYFALAQDKRSTERVAGACSPAPLTAPLLAAKPSEGATPPINQYRCAGCGAPVRPARRSVEHGWQTVCGACDAVPRRTG